MKIAKTLIEYNQSAFWASSAPPEDIKTRVGKFKVDIDLIRHGYRLVSLLMRDVVVFKAVSDFASKTVTYTALSPQFEPLPEDCLPPLYYAVVTKNPDMPPVLTWHKSPLDAGAGHSVGQKILNALYPPPGETGGPTLGLLEAHKKLADAGYMVFPPGTFSD